MPERPHCKDHSEFREGCLACGVALIKAHDEFERGCTCPSWTCPVHGERY